MIQDCGGFELKNPYVHNTTTTTATATSLLSAVAVSQTGVIIKKIIFDRQNLQNPTSANFDKEIEKHIKQ